MTTWNPGFTKFTYFYGEFPFSQWSASLFKIDNCVYNCNEQWMMASKARLFKDDESLRNIMKAGHPSDQKRFGRQVKNYNDNIWSACAKYIVIRGQIAKFSQNDAAFQELKKTTGTLLVEASPYDIRWGIGLSVEQALAGETWRGENWLGECITIARLMMIGE